MNAMGHVQSKWRPKGVTLTLHEIYFLNHISSEAMKPILTKFHI